MGRDRLADIPCPGCGRSCSKILETRQRPDLNRRRRECLFCGCRFTTIERIAPLPDNAQPVVPNLNGW